jgi:O-methyltransferase
VQRALAKRGYTIRRVVPRDIEPTSRATIDRVAPYTKTTPEALATLIAATEYVVARGIPGAFVECGVWRGGSVMAVAETLLRLDSTDRDLWLYDTFSGMTPPQEIDVRSFDGVQATDGYANGYVGNAGHEWARAEKDEVLANLMRTGYPVARLRFAEGRVEETIPAVLPESIALLRLDTDFYESTRHELEHLYPRLAVGGVLILDDYGTWLGARRAVDEYFAGSPPLLMRVDESVRLAVKATA